MRSIRAARGEGFAIGKLSELTGVNIETIRYYEKIELLPTPARTESGRRLYGSTERRILAFVRRCRELGFSLDEVRALMRLGGLEKPPAVRSRRLPRIISMTSARRSATCASWSACWPAPLPGAQAPPHPNVRYWIFWIARIPQSTEPCCPAKTLGPDQFNCQ